MREGGREEGVNHSEEKSDNPSSCLFTDIYRFLFLDVRPRGPSCTLVYILRDRSSDARDFNRGGIEEVH